MPANTNDSTNTITLKMLDGTIIKGEVFQPKEANTLRLEMCVDGQKEEGIWGCVSDEDRERLARSDRSRPYLVCLRNSSIMWYPRNTWGIVIPATLDGGILRCHVDRIDYAASVELNNGDMPYIREESK